MKVVVEVNGAAVMETLGKGIQNGAIAHWGTGVFHPGGEKSSAHIAIEEKIPGRSHTIKHYLGERSLKKGLESTKGVGVKTLEDGQAPAVMVDRLVQHCLFGETLHNRQD